MAGDELTAGKVKVELSGDSSKLEQAAKKGAEALKGLERHTERSSSTLGRLSGRMDSTSDAIHALGNATGISTDAFDKASTRLHGFSDIADASTASMGGLSRSVLVGAAAAAAIGVAAIGATAAISSLTLGVAEQVEAQEHIAQRTGISVRTQQEWSVAMAENGIASQSLVVAMRKLSENIVQARDSSSQAAVLFDELGVTGQDTETVIRQMADAFAKMADGPDKSRLAIQLLGRSGLELIPLLNRGSAAFDDSRRAAERFGVIVDSQATAALLRADDAADKMSVAMLGLKTQLAVTFAPSVATGIELITEAIAGLTNGIRNMTAEAERRQKGGLNFTDLLKSLFPILSIGAEFAQGVVTPPPPPPPPQNTPLDAAVGAFSLANAEKQEQLGQRQLVQDLARLQAARAIGKAEEALGTTQLQIIQRISKENSENFANEFQNGQTILRLTQEKAGYLITGQYAQAEVTQMMMDEAEALADTSSRSREKWEVSTAGAKILQANLIANYNEERRGIELTRAMRDDALAKQAQDYDAIGLLQERYYEMDRGLLGSAEAARQVFFQREQIAFQQRLARLQDEAVDRGMIEEEYYRRLGNLEAEHEANRIAIVQRFPTFVEQQLQSIVASNAFSLSQISSNFTNATAQWIVTGRGFEQFWTQLQVTIVQSFLNSLIQMGANFALSILQQQAAQDTFAAKTIASHTGLETAKTKITAAEEGIRMATTIATAKVGAAVGLAAIAGIATASMAVMQAVTIAIAGVFAAIGAGLAATVVGAPFAPAFEVAAGATIVAGTKAVSISTGIINGALAAATSTLAMAKGGILTKPTNVLAGEAGKESIIPLNERGAGFMADMLGLDGQRGAMQQTIYVMLDRRVIVEAVAEDLPSVLNLQGVPAAL